ncbi:Os01g0556201 [Babesia caballi]|uniref:Os01g0556201 n=1 Tax=Babesia caballi TaxID=5871 RepID=A0AAV4LS87_BABCB|nr:Os01g0556201 [Babesia caballi]
MEPRLLVQRHAKQSRKQILGRHEVVRPTIVVATAGARAGAGAGPSPGPGRGAEAVVVPAAVGVVEALEGVGYPVERRACARGGVLVRVELEGQLLVGPLDLAGAGVRRHAEHVVVGPAAQHLVALAVQSGVLRGRAGAAGRLAGSRGGSGSSTVGGPSRSAGPGGAGRGLAAGSFGLLPAGGQQGLGLVGREHPLGLGEELDGLQQHG